MRAGVHGEQKTAWFAIGEGCPSARACIYWLCPRAADTGSTAIASKAGRMYFPSAAIRTSQSRPPGRDATQRGTSLKPESIPPVRGRSCVESSSILSDQIPRKLSYQNDSVRPGAAIDGYCADLLRVVARRRDGFVASSRFDRARRRPAPESALHLEPVSHVEP